MNTEAGTILRGHPFYGWRIVLAGFIIIAFGSGAQNYVQSILALLVRDEFHGGAEALGLAMSILGLAGSVTLLAAGPIIDRFGPRKIMLIGIPLASVGFLGLSIVNNPFTLYVFGALIGIGLSAGFSLPVQTATANWFIKRRSTALAIVSAAVLGGPVVAVVGESIVDQLVWRGASLGLGLVILVIGVFLALIIKNRPEEHGYLPDGKVPVASEGGGTKKEWGRPNAEVSFTLRETLRTGAFWLLSVAAGLGSGLAVMTASYAGFHLVASQIFTPETASQTLDVGRLLGLAGILIFGYLGDLFSKRYLLAVAIAIQSMSVLILLTAGSTVQAYVYLLVFGLGSGMLPLSLAIRADYFGRRAFATITVATILVSGTITALLSALLGFVGRWTYDTSGGYELAFLAFMLIGFMPVVLFLLAKPPTPSTSSNS